MKKMFPLVFTIILIFLLGAGEAEKIGSSADRQLKWAVIKNSKILLDAAIKGGANPNQEVSPGRSLLMEASYNGRLYQVKELIKAGAKVNFVGKAGQSALIQSLNDENDRVARHLVFQGAKVNHRAESGTTALKVAVLQEKIELIKFLLSKGADSTLPVNSKKDIRSMALESKNIKLKELFNKK